MTASVISKKLQVIRIVRYTEQTENVEYYRRVPD